MMGMSSLLHASMLFDAVASPAVSSSLGGRGDAGNRHRPMRSIPRSARPPTRRRSNAKGWRARRARCS